MAFTILPIEINTHIASFLKTDRAVARFALICRETHAAIASPHSPIWRTRFGFAFDLIPNVPNDVLKAVYQRRMLLLRKQYGKGVNFVKGLTPKEKAVLACLKDLLCEAYAGIPKHNGGIAHNLGVIERVCEIHDLLDNVLAPQCFDKQTSSLLITLQVILTHLRFSLEPPTRTFSFGDAQKAVYKAPTKELLFTGKNRTDVNMRWVLHALTFFKHYMTTPTAALADQYAHLEDSLKIGPWKTNIKAGAMAVGKKWRGAYAYLKHDEIESVREGTDNEELEDRWCDAADVFQTLELDFADELFAQMNVGDRDSEEHHQSTNTQPARMPWPSIFERHLKSRCHPSLRAIERLVAADAAEESAAATTANDLVQGSAGRSQSVSGASSHSRTSSTTSTASSSSSTSSIASSQTSVSSSPSHKLPPTKLNQKVLNMRVTKAGAASRPAALKMRQTTPPTIGPERKPYSTRARTIGTSAIMLNSPTKPRATRAQARLQDGPSSLSAQTHLQRVKLDPSEITAKRQFQACGFDEEEFLASGHVTALPHQQGIPGWCRFTMMKFFAPLDDGGQSNSNAAAIKPPFDNDIMTGTDGLWAYEGVVLPGGKIIVGRWWSPESEGGNFGSAVGLGATTSGPWGANGEEIYSGPFMFWCVDE